MKDTQKSRKVIKNIKKYPKISRYTRKSQDLLKDLKIYLEISRSTPKFKKVIRNLGKSRKVAGDIEK